MQKPREINISLVVPVCNEATNLPECHYQLEKVLKEIGKNYEIIFINDGSTDKSLEIIKTLSEKDSAVKYIDLSRNFGQQMAISAGLEYARGQRVAIMDADLQDPPEVLIEMYNKLDTGYDVVYGKRKRRKGESILKRLTAKMFYRLLARMTNVKIPVDTGDFRMMTRQVVNELNKMPERDRFIRGQVAWVGFRQTEIIYERAGRQKGHSGYSYKKMIRFALDGLTSFSDFPLRFATWLGFFFSIISFAMIIWALYQRLIADSYVQGWTSLIISVLFLGGIQLITIGIIGEYISRIGSNVRRRPKYVVKDKNVDKPQKDELTNEKK
ncbi:MAG: glycosyltransferase [Candidatus Delongbacteria bacterium]|jgi:glycosyltransferase involved in cell wall biosynthesis|nr:glycosyltransferase [Candidatus Delongbacteria bacterium]